MDIDTIIGAVLAGDDLPNAAALVLVNYIAKQAGDNNVLAQRLYVLERRRGAGPEVPSPPNWVEILRSEGAL